MGVSEDFLAHLQSGVTTVCQAWMVRRGDGVTFGFTDHDRDLSFEGIVFQADGGMSAAALQQTTGLAVDNSEALGVLSDAGITEADIEAGRFDGAEVRAWLVNWAEVGQRHLIFRGSIGEVTRAGGAFRAELRGLTEALNRPLGRVYQKPCTAVLGDSACGFDLEQPGYSVELPVLAVETDPGRLRFAGMTGFAPGWFDRGTLIAVDGAAAGIRTMIRRDLSETDGRVIEPWQMPAGGLEPGDRVRLVAGCDRSLETCRAKFGNILNFRGFPDLPGEDWLMVQPRQSGVLSGGSRR